jgi:cation transport regulator ChaC
VTAQGFAEWQDGGYLFAYGSLIERASRLATVPSAERAYPAIVRGLRRGWWFQYDPALGPTRTPTYLGAVADATATCNGVVFEVPPTELERLIWREEGYVATRLDPAAIQVLEGDLDLRGKVVWYYDSGRNHLPSQLHPIIQTYVDTCIGGCLEIEELSPAARAAGFARQFIETTHDWRPPWFNDRPMPWRSTVHQPRAWEIDTLLHDTLGAELFGEIRIPGL